MSNKQLPSKQARDRETASVLKDDNVSTKSLFFQSDKKQCQLNWAQGLFDSPAGTLPLSSASEILRNPICSLLGHQLLPFTGVL